jgi:hypothetical protein
VFVKLQCRQLCFLAGTAGMLLTPVGLSAQAETAGYPVHGIVLDSVTHQPIARALVEQESAATLTDNEGRFELELPKGIQQIGVRRPGYRAGQEHAVNVGANTPALTFELTPQVFLSGHVTLSTGEPSGAIQVNIYRRSIVDTVRESWVVVQSLTTDADGGFRSPGLEAGGSYVVCTAPTEEDDARTDVDGRIAPPVRFGYATVCFPGPIPDPTPDLTSDLTSRSSRQDSANTLALTPGQHAEVDLQLTRQPFYRVTLSIPHAESWPEVAVTIDSALRPHDHFTTDWKPEQGLAEARLPSGEYSALAVAPGEVSAYGRLDFRVSNKPVSGLSLPLFPRHAIPVEVHKDYTVAPPADQRGGLAERSDPGVSLTFVAADDSTQDDRFGGGLGHPRGTADNSLFELESAPPGKYWVQAYPTNGYIGSISSGGVDLSRQPLTIGTGSTAAPILVNLRNDFGQIQATVRPNADTGEASAVAGAPGEVGRYFVYAVPVGRILWQFPQGQGQGTEPISISSVPPGTYRVVAFDRPQQFNLADAGTLSRIAEVGQSVTVTARATVNVQLTVAHAISDEPNETEVVL